MLLLVVAFILHVFIKNLHSIVSVHYLEFLVILTESNIFLKNINDMTYKSLNLKLSQAMAGVVPLALHLVPETLWNDA